MSSKGFTLIEVLLVLSVIAVLGVCLPFLKVQSSLQLSYEMKIIYHKLLYAQAQSIAKKKTISVDFQGDSYHINNDLETFSSSMHCSSIRFHFTPLGTISKAGTITCSLQGYQKKIILQLGSGRIYVE